MAHRVVEWLSTSPCIKAHSRGNSVWGIGSQGPDKTLGTAPAPIAGRPTSRPSDNCHIYVEGLGWSHVGSQVVGSYFVSSYELRLVISLTFLMMSLTSAWHLHSLLPLLIRISQDPPDVAFQSQMETWSKVNCHQSTRITSTKTPIKSGHITQTVCLLMSLPQLSSKTLHPVTDQEPYHWVLGWIDSQFP